MDGGQPAGSNLRLLMGNDEAAEAAMAASNALLGNYFAVKAQMNHNGKRGSSKGVGSAWRLSGVP